VPARPKAAPQLTGPVQLDDDTRNALILFNARLVAQDELEREKRRVDKAAKAKDEAAAKVRELENDSSATSEQKSEAQAAYIASLDALNRAKAGEPLAAEAPEPDDESAEREDEAAELPADVVDAAAAEAEVEVEVEGTEPAPDSEVEVAVAEPAPDSEVEVEATEPAAEAEVEVEATEPAAEPHDDVAARRSAVE
jgi:hypothetical protein